MRSRELSSMKSDGVSARSSPQRMPVQQSSPKPPHADAISRGRSVRSPVASASSSARRSGPFVLGPSGSPTPSRVVSGHLGDDHSHRSRLQQGTECSRQPTPGSQLQGNLARAHEEIPCLKRPSTRNSLKPEDRQPQLSSLTDQQNSKSAAESAVPTRRQSCAYYKAAIFLAA